MTFPHLRTHCQAMQGQGPLASARGRLASPGGPRSQTQERRAKARLEAPPCPEAGVPLGEPHTHAALFLSVPVCCWGRGGMNAGRAPGCALGVPRARDSSPLPPNPSLLSPKRPPCRLSVSVPCPTARRAPRREGPILVPAFPFHGSGAMDQVARGGATPSICGRRAGLTTHLPATSWGRGGGGT